MVLPLVIFVVCFGVGATATAAWLPDLDRGSVGSIAFFLVCGLLGAALGLIGLHLYSVVRELRRNFFGGNSAEGYFFASEISSMLFDSSSITALAAVVYLLAPRPPADSVRAAVGGVPTGATNR